MLAVQLRVRRPFGVAVSPVGVAGARVSATMKLSMSMVRPVEASFLLPERSMRRVWVP